MAERLKNRASTASSKRRRPFRVPEPWPDASEALIALGRAWMVTAIATALLFAALVIAPMWDTAIFMQALRETASNDPQVWQPLGLAAADGPADGPADGRTPSPITKHQAGGMQAVSAAKP